MNMVLSMTYGKGEKLPHTQQVGLLLYSKFPELPEVLCLKNKVKQLAMKSKLPSMKTTILVKSEF